MTTESAGLRHVACPIALHPDGAPHRIPVFRHPVAGMQVVQGEMRAGARADAAAARELFEESGLETRSAITLGHSDAIQDGSLWHFALCRVASPVRAQWQHLCRDDGGHVFVFKWQDLDTVPPEMDPIFQRAMAWMRGAL